MSSLASTLRARGLGRMWYAAWHRPIGAVRASYREGGPLQQWRTAQARCAMERAARSLTPPDFPGEPLRVHLLSGSRFWYQTAFCLWTLSRHSGRPLAPIIYDDGSLSAECREPLARIFPQSSFVERSEARARLDRILPAASFPALHERWENYPHIRKLIDPHVGSSGSKLVLDSDLLFFSRPEQLLQWSGTPIAPLHAVDIETSYGYSRPLLEKLAGCPLAERVNVGVCGFDSAGIDWHRLEHWCRTLIENEGTHYYLEQALFALLVAGRATTVLRANEYVTGPRQSAAHHRGVMHHYVASSKRWYFRTDWRLAAE